METIFSVDALVNQAIVILNAFIAAVLAGLIGYERESKHKPAGLRTNMIIASVAVLLVSLGRGLALEFESIEGVRVDPIRIIEAVIVGVSFIGAGTIIKSEPKQDPNARADVQNLTTAATLLFSAGIGIAVALQQYVLAIGVTALALFINLVVRKFMLKLNGRNQL